jgi:hypothetical protein
MLRTYAVAKAIHSAFVNPLAPGRTYFVLSFSIAIFPLPQCLHQSQVSIILIKAD